VIAIVSDDVVAPLGDAGHRLFGAFVKARAMMKEHDNRKRPVTIGSHDMDSHGTVRRANRFRN
jgi:hypothetical protein